MHLSSNAIQYVLFHLNQHWEAIPEVVDAFRFMPDSTGLDTAATAPSILFPLSEQTTPNPITIRVLDTEIPLLFPGTPSDADHYTLDENGNLIFHHDFLSSAFYFLAGVGEYESGLQDEFGRFPFGESLQKELGCVTLPVVNYYFEVILSGIEAYCKCHQLPFKRKRLFENFGFLLSHDVDRVAFYHPREILFKIKQLIGLAPKNYSYAATIRTFFQGLFFFMNPLKKKDPWWNLPDLMSLEKELNIRSSWYFLNRENRKRDSKYRLSQKKIRELMKQLENEGFEAGLHGTWQSATDAGSMKKQTSIFKEVMGFQPVGIRQHYLRLSIPLTFKLQRNCGFRYDTSLGFAEHEGYRNGYCYPFKIYDHTNDRETGMWEFPLTLMEVSVLNYRKAGLNELEKSALQLIEEASKFGGLFSLLWHNCRMMDEEYPGVSQFYPQLLKRIVDFKPEALTGKDLVEKLDKTRMNHSA